MKCRICKQEIKRRSGAGVFYRSASYGSIIITDYVMPMHASCATDPFDRRRYVDIDKADYILKDYIKSLKITQVFMLAVLLVALFLVDQKYVTVSVITVLAVDFFLSIDMVICILIMKKLKRLPL